MSDVSKFWRYSVEGQEDVLVYTENLAVLKEKKSIKCEPSGWYYRHGKLFAVQYLCRADDAAHKALTKFLHLKPEDEVKEKRKRRTNEEMEEFRQEQLRKDLAKRDKLQRELN